MKKLLLIAAMASLSAPAFASKARVNALGNAAHLVDTQTVFNNPSYLTLMGDYATFETGPTNPTYSATANPSNSAQAEGGFVRSQGDAKWMAYLGKKSDFTSVYRQFGGFQGQVNPIEIDYAQKGAISWGVGFNYSSSDTKSSAVPQKQHAMGMRVGATTDTWDAYANIGLGSEATGSTGGAFGAAPLPAFASDADAKMTGTSGFKVGAGYKMENLYPYLVYYQDGFKLDSAANAAWDGEKIGQNQLEVGVVDHNKIEGGQWFYGVAYQMYNRKYEGTVDVKTTASYLPFLVGVEYDATSWATVRASASQNVLLGSTKTEVSGTGDADTIANNTKVAAGLGLKFNKWVLDGSMAASTTGDVNTASFLTNVGLTYMF